MNRSYFGLKTLTTASFLFVFATLTGCPDDDQPLVDAGPVEDGEDDSVIPNPTDECGNGVVDTGEFCDISGVGNDKCLTEQECNQARNGDPCWKTTFTQLDPNNACTRRCEVEQVSAPADGDGCCPPGADGQTDTDCPSSCGNGAIDDGETCDNGNGSPTPCPTSETCIDNDPCTNELLVENGCQSECQITNVAAGEIDQCCPAGADASSDPDCDAICGDGIVSLGERCDDGPNTTEACPTIADCDDSDPCTVDSVGGEGCQKQCVRVPAAPGSADQCCPAGATHETDPDCEEPTVACGNGVIDEGELCDDGEGSPRPCPTAVNDCPAGPLADACESYAVRGTASACSAECFIVRNTEPTDNDGCCADQSTTSKSEDNDCPASVTTYGECAAKIDCIDQTDDCIPFAYLSGRSICTPGCDETSGHYGSTCPLVSSEILGEPASEFCITSASGSDVSLPYCMPVANTPYFDENISDWELLPANEGDTYSNIVDEPLGQGKKDIYFMRTGNVTERELWRVVVYPNFSSFLYPEITIRRQQFLRTTGAACSSNEFSSWCDFYVDANLDNHRMWVEIDGGTDDSPEGTRTYSVLFTRNPG